MKFKIIQSPSKGTLDMLMRRMGGSFDKGNISVDAVGLVQGALIDMIWATDIAEKAVGVTVYDVRGSCPQNMIMIGIFGDTVSVKSAIQEIKSNLEGENNLC